MLYSQKIEPNGQDIIRHVYNNERKQHQRTNNKFFVSKVPGGYPDRYKSNEGR